MWLGRVRPREPAGASCLRADCRDPNPPASLAHEKVQLHAQIISLEKQGDRGSQGLVTPLVTWGVGPGPRGTALAAESPGNPG